MELINEILRIAKKNQFGFTINLNDLKPIVSGYVCAYFETQNCFGVVGLTIVIEHAQSHDNIVGGWFNIDNKQYYFDSCKQFDNEFEAIEFAKQNKQIAIFDLNNLREIRI